MPTRIARLLPTPIAFAHRGARAHERDNTIPAFELALRLGATGLESDVWLTSDGEAVLDHDGLVGRIGRRRRYSVSPRSELPDHVPTLDELFEAVGTDFELSLDVKDAACVKEVVASVARADKSGELASRVWLCHPKVERLTEWRDQWPEVRYVNSVRFPKISEPIEVRAAALAAAGIDAMNMHYSDWSGGLTTLFHRFEVLAFGWDAQHERVIDELLDHGCDAVYSDHVDRMMAVVNAKG